jgi:hypothetical protein
VLDRITADREETGQKTTVIKPLTIFRKIRLWYWEDIQTNFPAKFHFWSFGGMRGSRMAVGG